MEYKMKLVDYKKDNKICKYVLNYIKSYEKTTN